MWTWYYDKHYDVVVARFTTADGKTYNAQARGPSEEFSIDQIIAEMQLNMSNYLASRGLQ
jgi:hypothetical protein